MYKKSYNTKNRVRKMLDIVLYNLFFISPSYDIFKYINMINEKNLVTYERKYNA